jgi:phosphoribosyl-ATP pyrophosphohydrolase
MRAEEDLIMRKGRMPQLAKKLVEEAVEVAIAGLGGDQKKAVGESADLLERLRAFLAGLGVPSDAVEDELEERSKSLRFARMLRPKRKRKRRQQ